MYASSLNVWSCSAGLDLPLLTKLDAASTTASTCLSWPLVWALPGAVGSRAARMRFRGGSAFIASSVLRCAFFWRRNHLCQRGTGCHLRPALLLSLLLPAESRSACTAAASVKAPALAPMLTADGDVPEAAAGALLAEGATWQAWRHGSRGGCTVGLGALTSKGRPAAAASVCCHGFGSSGLGRSRPALAYPAQLLSTVHCSTLPSYHSTCASWTDGALADESVLPKDSRGANRQKMGKRNMSLFTAHCVSDAAAAEPANASKPGLESLLQVLTRSSSENEWDVALPQKVHLQTPLCSAGLRAPAQPRHRPSAASTPDLPLLLHPSRLVADHSAIPQASPACKQHLVLGDDQAFKPCMDPPTFPALIPICSGF